MDMIQNKKMHLLTIIINIFFSSFKVNNLNWYKLNILFRNRMNITYDMLNRVCIAYFIFYLLSIRNFWSCYFVQAVWASPFIICFGFFAFLTLFVYVLFSFCALDARALWHSDWVRSTFGMLDMRIIGLFDVFVWVYMFLSPKCVYVVCVLLFIFVSPTFIQWYELPLSTSS